MEIILNIVLLVLLGTAFFQDKSSRSISVFIFAALAIVTSLMFYARLIRWEIVLANIGFTLVIILGLFLYFSFKEGHLTNIFKAYFGIGDLVFFLVVTPLFSTRNFILFFITGIVFSGVFHWMVQRKYSGETVPLAGYLSLYLIGIKTFDFFIQRDLLFTDII